MVGNDLRYILYWWSKYIRGEETMTTRRKEKIGLLLALSWLVVGLYHFFN
jgi:hypothetical protein